MRLKALIREMQREVVQVCAYCDVLRPIDLDKSKAKSHGMCKEHYFAFYVQRMNLSSERAKIQVSKLSNNSFVPNTSNAKETDTLPNEKL
jgi:hypothetical protein